MTNEAVFWSASALL